MTTGPQKRRVLITGANGFLGRTISALMAENQEYELVCTDRKLHDLTKLDEAITACRNADTVIHLAGHVRSRQEQNAQPAETLFNNIAVTLNVAEAARRNNVSRIIFMSSVTAYPETAAVPFQEKALWDGPVEPGSYAYGTAKRLTATISQAYNEQWGIETTTLFLPNLYGPGDKFDHERPPFVPNVILQIEDAIRHQKPRIYGGDNGDLALDLLYVYDAAQAVLSAVETPALPSMLNLGTDKAITIKEVYATIADVLGYNGVIEWAPATLPRPTRLMDTTLAHQNLGWYSQTSFKEGITRTIHSRSQNEK